LIIVLMGVFVIYKSLRKSKLRRHPEELEG